MRIEQFLILAFPARTDPAYLQESTQGSAGPDFPRHQPWLCAPEVLSSNREGIPDRLWKYLLTTSPNLNGQPGSATRPTPPCGRTPQTTSLQSLFQSIKINQLGHQTPHSDLRSEPDVNTKAAWKGEPTFKQGNQSRLNHKMSFLRG